MVSRQRRKILLELSALVRKEENQYVSWCPEFDVSSCGDDIEEACNNLFDAVDLYLRTLGDEGELANVFQERNIRPVEDAATCSRVFLSSWRTGITAPV